MLVSAEHLSINFGSRQLLQDVNFYLNEGDKVGVIGINGTGKSTFLKVLSGGIRPDEGRVQRDPNVQISYLPQNPIMEDDATVLEQVFLHFPAQFRALNEYEAKSMLTKLGFTDLSQKVGTLSGGQRKRVALAAALIHPADVLILDEPTNHLDITSKEILEKALNSYTGTLLYVSHDRYFINQTATRILDLTNQAMVNYIGNYDYYLEKKEELTKIYAPESDDEVPEETLSATKLDWKQQKEEQARQRKRENDLKKTEAEIEKLETRDREIDEEMNKPEIAVNVSECVRLSKEKAEIAEKLEVLYEKWEELA